MDAVAVHIMMKLLSEYGFSAEEIATFQRLEEASREGTLHPLSEATAEELRVVFKIAMLQQAMDMQINIISFKACLSGEGDDDDIARTRKVLIAGGLTEEECDRLIVACKRDESDEGYTEEDVELLMKVEAILNAYVAEKRPSSAAKKHKCTHCGTCETVAKTNPLGVYSGPKVTA